MILDIWFELTLLSKVCSEPTQAPEVRLFAEISPVLNYGLFFWRPPSLMFDWIVTILQRVVTRLSKISKDKYLRNFWMIHYSNLRHLPFQIAHFFQNIFAQASTNQNICIISSFWGKINFLNLYSESSIDYST